MSEGALCSSTHPHEPEIPPALTDDGRCRICALFVELDDTRKALAESERVRKLLAEALVIAGDALRTCKVEAEADTGDPVWHLPNLIALTVDEPRVRIAAALAESGALDQETGE